MEGLVIILAELLAGMLMPLIGAIAGLLAAIAELLLLLLTALLDARPERRRTPARDRKPWSRLWLHIPAAIGGTALLVVLAANLFFFEPVLRYALGHVEERTGYAVTFEHASGNLLTGRLSLSGADVDGQADKGLSMDLGIDAVTVDLALPSLLFGTARIEDLEIAGVSGTILMPPKGTGDAGLRVGDAAKKPRRAFMVEAGRFDDLDLTIVRGEAAQHRIEIASAEVAPFRSASALFDLFFRSNLDARIDGVPLRVVTEVIAGDGRRTEWHFDDVPAATLAGLVERAPLNWLADGTLSVHVEDEWALDDRRVDMNWSIAFDAVEVVAPDGAGRAERIAVAALATALTRRDGDARFDFALALDRDRLETSGSEDLSALWDALKDAIAIAVAAQTGEKVDSVREKIGKAGSALRGLLDPATGD